MTANGHESDQRHRMTANSLDDLPGEQGIANAVDGIGSGQKTATGHIESGLGETGIYPRIGPVSPRAKANTTGSGVVRRPRLITSQPFAGGQRPRRRLPPTLSTA